MNQSKYAALNSFQDLLRKIDRYSVNRSYNLPAVVCLPKIQSISATVACVYRCLNDMEIFSCSVRLIDGVWCLQHNTNIDIKVGVRCSSTDALKTENDIRMALTNLTAQLSISQDKLFMVEIVETRASFLVLLALHHIICDGESISRLSNAMRQSVRYRNACAKPDSYLERLSCVTNSEKMSGSASYWSRYVTGLTAKRVFVSAHNNETGSCSVTLRDPTQAAIRFSDDLSVTLNILFHWIISASLDHVFPSDGPGQSIGVPFSRREGADVVGALITVVPFHGWVKCESEIENLKRLRHTYLSHYKNRAYPMLDVFEHAKRYHGPTSTLYECVYTYLDGEFQSKFDLGNLATSAIEIDVLRVESGYYLAVRYLSSLVPKAFIGNFLAEVCSRAESLGMNHGAPKLVCRE